MWGILSGRTGWMLGVLAVWTSCGGGAPPPPDQKSSRESPVIQPVDRQPSSHKPAIPDTPDHARRRAVLVQRWGAAIREVRVREAMQSVLRHAFVPSGMQGSAYLDEALPIGEGQTISQPWVVARMTELLEVPRGGKVLEVGTGSGYQAAVLARLGGEVYTIEIIPKLADRARTVLEGQGYRNIHFRVGDGYVGWPEAAPFDAVIITAAVDHVPAPLLDQLTVGGRLVLPLGTPDDIQYLTRYTRMAKGVQKETFSAVRFVPMTGKALR